MRRISSSGLRFVLLVYAYVILGQGKENLALGHRERALMRSLISPLQGIINALLNGQLDLSGCSQLLELLASPHFTATY